MPEHQHIAERDETVIRTPAEYAAHAQDMLRRHGPVSFEVQELLVEADHVFVRWAQHGRTGLTTRSTAEPRQYHREAGSAVYRVAGGRIQEYWIQLDRFGDEAQLACWADTPCARPSSTPKPGPLPPSAHGDLP